MPSNKVIFLTGVSGAGKTSLANVIVQSYSPSILLDADNLRRNFWPELGLSMKDRKENNLRIARMANLLNQQLINTLIIIACIAPQERARNEMIEIIGSVKLVYLTCNLQERIRRDPKGLYARAIKGEIKDLTGYDGIYEEPNQPDLIIHTDQLTLQEELDLVLQDL